MGSRDKKRIRVRASKRRLNSSSGLSIHTGSSRDVISSRTTRRSERILNQDLRRSLAAERAVEDDQERPGPSRRSRDRRRSRSRSHEDEEPDEDELIIAQQPEPENGKS